MIILKSKIRIKDKKFILKDVSLYSKFTQTTISESFI